MLPRDRPNSGELAAQPSQDEEIIVPEEDALVLRMEAMMAEADAEGDQPEERLSFADSERFDDDDEEQFSAQASESSSFSHHWRGWTGRSEGNAGILMANPTLFGQEPSAVLDGNNEAETAMPPTLKDLAARKVASALSFDLMESTYAQLPRAQKRLRPMAKSVGESMSELQDYLPEQLVLLILRHCFPESVENIRLYSCLTNCGDRLFSLGEQLFQNGAVSELFQIGYHLSAVVQERFGAAENGRTFDVCIRVDRCRIVSCSCSCSNSSFWCQHAVAACLQRIQKPDSVRYRPAIWDSITSLRDTELKKLAQYLINELPKEYIPVAQKLIDTLKDPHSDINRTQGAPDPTAGPTDDTPAVWCMDERALHEEVRKTLVNFMRPSAMVCEVQSLLTSPPALAHEWSILHRTFCTKQPESMWNLLGMVRVMLTRGDANGPALLHVLTEQCLALDSVLLRWYQISLVASGHWHPIGPSGAAQRGNAQQSQSRQLNVFLLCQEIIRCWRLVALNPRLNPVEKEKLWSLLQLYQKTAVSRIWAILGKMAVAENNVFGTVVDSQGHRLCQQNAPFTRHFFPTFFPALQACRQLDWTKSDAQRLVQTMDIGSHLDTDIRMAKRQSGNRFPNFPFLRETANGIFLLDLVEMEQQLGTSCTYHSDAVVLPPKCSRRRKKRRKGHSKKGKGSAEKEVKSRKSDGKGVREQRRRHSNEPEQLSEVSSEDEQVAGDRTAHFFKQKREAYEDSLDTLFAEAHAEFDDPQSMRFTCCEALFAHGYFRESLQLADQLSAELLASQPNLLLATAIGGTSLDDAERTDGLDSMSEETGTGGSMEGSSQLTTKETKGPHLGHSLRFQQFRRQFSSDSFRRLESHYHSARGGGGSSSARGWLSRSHPRLMASSLLTRETLWRTLFLAKLLLLGEEFFARKRNNCREAMGLGPEPGHFRLRALELCLASLRNVRGPAATKLLEMEINQLEGDVFALLHRLELCPTGLKIVRSLAEQYLGQACGKMPKNVTLPPTRMAHYMVNALSYSHHMRSAHGGQNRGQADVLPPCQSEVLTHRVPADDDLALKLALQVLDKDVHISEADHPLLCECIRRHRKDLQMMLLTRNRDSPEKLCRVLATVLDSKVHRMYEDRHRSNVDFFMPPQSAAAQENNTASAAGQRPPPSISAQSSISSASSPSISPFQIPGKIGFEVASRRTSGEQSAESGLAGICRIERFSHHYHAAAQSLRVLANQASEAQAHHMFEFAKSVLQEAGGNQSSAMFNPMLVEGAAGALAAGFQAGGGGVPGLVAGPHRNLHISSLLIALYALGLNNECSPSWNTRTYSTHVSWIQAQALDIGRQALEIIRCTWRKHLTPTEVASLADKASQSADQATVEEAAQLALSVLPEANSLLPTESQKALNQCKERSPKMLEEACLAVEKAAERGGVYPEVLFRVAHHWYDLYLAHIESCMNCHQQSVQCCQQSLQIQWNHQMPISPSSSFGYCQPPPWHHCQQQFRHFLPPQNAGFYSPSIPPPPLPHGGALAASPGTNTYRLQSSHSAPNMSGQQSTSSPQLFPPAALPSLFPPASAYGRMPLAGIMPVHCMAANCAPPPAISQAPPPMPLMQQQPLQHPQPLVNLMQISPPNQQRMAQSSHYLTMGHRTTRFLDERSLQLLKNAHRVGIAAMNNLRSGESLSAKFAKNPPSCDEICWLLEVSMEIGDPDYVRLFCEKAITCVGSPFVLLELLKGVFKFFQHLPNAHRIPGTGQLETIMQSASGDSAKLCLQQAKIAMAQHQMAGPLSELALHGIATTFSAACHKLNFNNFQASDQEYVCELALLARELFRLIPPYPYHEQGKRKSYIDILLEHYGKQKVCRKLKSVQTAVLGVLQPQQQQQTHQRQHCANGIPAEILIQKH